jgi:Ca-activated chloride channel family protein
MCKAVFLLWILVCSAAAFGQAATEGSLFATGKDGSELGACPLRTTVVKAGISGFLARVTVRQEFENKFDVPIEAVYVFPLSQNGAVDSMTMTVGTRNIRGRIMKREEARQTYEAAKTEGRTASLLDQERPNIFTQSVANIMPGESVIVEISYVETLKYEDGGYEFVFPMTVAPRYVPAGVADAEKISPPVAATRNGTDISVEVNLDAGVPVEEIRSTSHDITQVNFSPASSKVTLRDEKTIPNKDFILRYDVTGKRIEDAVLTHRDARGGFFTLILQPPDQIATEDRTPKEIVFVLDTSGSMGGFPIEKAKEAMKLSLDGLYPDDTFNLITFAGDTAILFDKPVPATRANLDAAQAFLATRHGYGGTEMMKAIKAALEPSDASDHLRIVCFMTDGEVGNDDAIIAEVQRHPNARVFSFGIGSSVNRSLLDKIALEGKGEAEYVGLTDDGSKAARKFYERVRTPLLTDLSIDWNGSPVADVFPGRLTDLFSAKPVILHGRYTKAANGTIKLRGKVAGQPYERTIALNLPESDAANDVLATLWARTRIDDLSSLRLKTADNKAAKELDSQITNIGLEFGLLTNFTSFVAVEDRVSNPNGPPTTVVVPNVLPQGMDPSNATVDVSARKGLPVNARSASNYALMSTGATVTVTPDSKVKRSARKSGSGQGSGRGSGSGMGMGSGGGGGGSANAVVNVTADSSNVIDMSQTSINTTISREVVESLPKGANFSSLLRTAPNVVPQPLSGEFQIDGASGSENVFVIDGQEVTNLRTGVLGPKKDTTLSGRAVAVAEPVYPAEAKAANATGEVVVEVKIGRDGTVLSAKSVSGSELLRAASESAAMLSKFAPAYSDGKAVRVTGLIAYDFKDPEHVSVFLRKMKAEPLSEEDKRAAAVESKLHFWLSDMVTRLQNGVAVPGANEARFVRDGKAEVRIGLSARTKSVIAKLRAAGFEMVRESGSGVEGKIEVGRIAALAEIDEVTIILPNI